MRKVFIVLMLIFFFYGCSKTVESVQADTPKSPLEVMREGLADAYRLHPDKRFLLAVAEVHHFFTEEPKTGAIVSFQNGRWQIVYRDIKVGALPELPDFSDGIALLESWAKTLHQKHPIHFKDGPSVATLLHIDNQLKQFLAPHAAKAAQQADNLWRQGERYPILLRIATRSLVLLTVQGLDSLETADILPARAMAFLAITKAATNYQVAREESLLAYSMGYSSYSITAAKVLPVQDAVRLYVNRDDQLLKDIAERENGTIEARYLYLLRLAKLGDVDGLTAWLKRFFTAQWFSLPVYKTLLDLQKFSITPVISELLPRLTLVDLAREADYMPDLVEVVKKANNKNAGLSDEELKNIFQGIELILKARTSTLVDNFESGLKMFDKSYPGPFLDSSAYQAYYSGYFFSSFYTLGLHYLDSLSSTEAVNKFAGLLGQSKSGIAKDFQQWYRNLAKSKEGAGDFASLMEDMFTLNHIGADTLMRTFTEQRKYYANADTNMLKAAKLFTQHLDTRVSHRFHLADIAYRDLMDMQLSGKIYRSVMTVAPATNNYLQAWYANFSRDRKRLEELLHSDEIKFETRAAIVGFLGEQEGVEKETLQNEYQALINEKPDNWYVRDQYAKYLEKEKKYSEARSVMEDWLKRKVATADLAPIVAQTTIARMYYNEGRYKEGLAAIKPVVGSWQSGAMERAAMLLDKLEQKENAEKMAQAVLSRYPDSVRTRTLMAEIYWRHGKYDEAAVALKSAPIKISINDWQFVIALKFSDAFSDKPKEEAVSALSALIKQNISHLELLRLSFPFAKAGRNELAFAISSALKWGGLGNLEFVILSYNYLKAWKGEKAALEWVRQKVPAQMINPASMIIYDHKEFDLLWTLIEDPGKGEEADFVWLMRAAAAFRVGLNNHPHRKELMDYYNKNPKGHYNRLGAFLVGLQSEKDTLLLATDMRKQCEVAYYVGLKAMQEGRYEDASDWFRIAIETGIKNTGEYRWSFSILYYWYSNGKGLTPLPEKGYSFS